MNPRIIRTLALNAVMLWLILPAWGQLVYTADFTRKLHNAGIAYAEPTEQWFHVVKPPKDDFMKYDLVLENDRNDFEARYRIRHLEEMIPPSVEVSRLVASLASNTDADDIIVKVPPTDFLKEAFNAERGVIAYFTPKPEFSGKPHGALLSLYTKGRPVIDVVLLYFDPSFEPLYAYRSLRFLDMPVE